MAGLRLFLTILVLIWVARRAGEIFYSAALTPGLVISKSPLEFISLADMDSGIREPAYAVKRVAIHRLPCHCPDTARSSRMRLFGCPCVVCGDCATNCSTKR